MRYYNPRNNNTARKNRAPRYTERDYKKLKFPEKKEPEKKKKKLFTVPRLITASAIVIAMIITSVVILPATARAQYSTGYEVFLCGKSVGIVDDPKAVDSFLEKTRQELTTAYGMKTTDQLEIEYKPVETSSKHICPADSFNNLIKDNIDVKIMAPIIYVNDWPAAVVKTFEEAEWVLAKAKEPYENPTKGALYTDIEFVEEVRIEEGPADYKQIVDRETALHNLTIGPGVEDKWHIVVTGESLSRIAKKERVKVSDIRIANPSVSSTDSIYPGDKLRVVVPRNSISIKFKEVIDRVQEKPFEIQIIKDDTKFSTEKTIIQQGKVGESRVKAEITYVNGIEVDFHIQEEHVLSQPVTQIIKKGTKKVPRELTLAVEGRMPFPIEKGKYRISSPFGPRKAPTKGASTFHKGIDLAAPKGTPIYASQAGKVTYSGTNGGYGLFVKIRHDGGVETRYGHCSQLLVKKGKYVKKGQLIALVGSTGVSSGNHVHFEIRINGHAVDPQKGK
jgi:murein DD-endopeptidase MepM/ murein hydrolase activator NlpD